MHTALINDNNPHVRDEPVEFGDDERTIAYMPRLVHKLATNPFEQGGGARRARTNADSYLQMINALYWWDTTGYFPEAPNQTMKPATEEYGQHSDNLPLGTSFWPNLQQV
ncbi:hypothetical protein VTN77DRAFT_7435 [Rasamsonia byssochlamydoides]|uniref:uncharacterized protein n=1 Tax=Rasamsonia byssochlamydoides TaxID=89139 RepID=UPI0037420FEE